MASLTGSSIASSYTSLLKLNGNTDNIVAGNGSNAIQVVDGDGTTSPLYLNTDRLGIGGQPSSLLSIKGQDPTFTIESNRDTVSSSEILGQIDFRTNEDSFNNEPATSARIKVLEDQYSATTMSFHTSINPDDSLNTAMTIDKSANIGIGTATPSSFDSEANNLVVGNGSGDNGITIFTGSSAGDYGSIFFGDATGTPKQGQIRYEQNNEVMSFYTNTTERMRIDLNGNVGIGENSPNQLLHLKATNGAEMVLQRTSGDTSSLLGGIHFGNSDVDEYLSSIYSYQDGATDSAYLSFHTEVTGGSKDERMRITSGGDVQLKERLTFSDTNDTTATATINLHSNNYLYVTGGTSGLSLTAEGGADKVQIEDGGGSGRILFECTNTQVAKFDTNSRISLSNNDSGTSNTIFGKNAGASIDAGSNYNTFIGENVADASLNDATYNVGIGHNALTDLTTADSTVAIGGLCLENITTGAENTVIGAGAMRLSLLASNCVFVGREAGGNGEITADANGSVGVGMQSLYALTSGAKNTAVGHASGADVTTGYDNTLIGYNSGNTGTVDLDGGNSNTFVGAETRGSNASAINQTVIGKGAQGQGNNLVVLGNADVTKVYMSQDGDAEMYANGTINTSDKRLKEDISNSDLGLSFINELRPVSYKFKNDKKPEKLKYGIIAQEVQEVLKESGNENFAGITDKGEYLGADYVQFIAPLIKAVQELSAKVEELENK